MRVCLLTGRGQDAAIHGVLQPYRGLLALLPRDQERAPVRLAGDESIASDENRSHLLPLLNDWFPAPASV
jgi:hypothetical protein